MKLHRNVVAGVITGLKDILLGQKQADLVVGRLLQSNKNWGARDRNFIAENIYHITRYKRLYAYCCDVTPANESEFWKILGAKLILENTALPEWSEFEGLNTEHILQKNEEAQKIRKIRESVPDWLDELGEHELGAAWESELTALNQPAKLCIRINRLRNTANAVKQFLEEQKISFHETGLAPDALVLDERKNLTRSEAYKNGWFEIQDVSSQCVAPFAEVEPGMLVIDGCAGAGGKTLHIGSLMQNKGDIIAFDVSKAKLEELAMRAKRAGCTIIKTVEAENLNAPLKIRFRERADRLLLDVPCSGTGVLRRKPDAKWSLSAQFISQIIATQASILDTYTSLLKTNGLLIYSTCSILPSENEKQIAAFVERTAGTFELLGRRIAGEIFPEIVDILDLPRAHNVVEHSADFRRGVGIVDRWLRGHGLLPSLSVERAASAAMHEVVDDPGQGADEQHDAHAGLHGKSRAAPFGGVGIAHQIEDAASDPDKAQRCGGDIADIEGEQP